MDRRSTPRAIKLSLLLVLFVNLVQCLTLEALRGGGGWVKVTRLDFFGFKFFLSDLLSKVLVQLFFVR